MISILTCNRRKSAPDPTKWMDQRDHSKILSSLGRIRIWGCSRRVKLFLIALSEINHSQYLEKLLRLNLLWLEMVVDSRWTIPSKCTVNLEIATMSRKKGLRHYTTFRSYSDDLSAVEINIQTRLILCRRCSTSICVSLLWIVVLRKKGQIIAQRTQHPQCGKALFWKSFRHMSLTLTIPNISH